MSKFTSIIAILFVILWGCNNQEQTETPLIPEKEDINLTSQQLIRAQITTDTLSSHLLSKDIKARGSIKVAPQSIATATSITGGSVVKILVSQGRYVEKHTPLAILTHPELTTWQLDYLRMQQQTILSRLTYHRQEILYKQNVAPHKILQEAYNNYLSDSLNMLQLADKLAQVGIKARDIEQHGLKQNFTLYAPISGQIEQINIHMGSWAQTGESLFKIIDTRNLYLEIHVFEKDLHQIKKGQRIDFMLAAISGKKWETSISSIGASINENSRVVTLTAPVKNGQDLLLPGMFVSATIHTGEQIMQAVPETALVYDSDTTAVIYYTQNQGKSFFPLAVATGVSEDGWVQVILNEPLPDGARIAMQGAHTLHATSALSEE